MKTSREFLIEAADKVAVPIGSMVSVELACALMDSYALYVVKQDREALYAKRMKFQYFRKQELIDLPLPK